MTEESTLWNKCKSIMTSIKTNKVHIFGCGPSQNLVDTKKNFYCHTLFKYLSCKIALITPKTATVVHTHHHTTVLHRFYVHDWLHIRSWLSGCPGFDTCASLLLIVPAPVDVPVAYGGHGPVTDEESVPVNPFQTTKLSPCLFRFTKLVNVDKQKICFT